MLSEKFINLCDHLGFRLSWRNSDDSWVWDGQSLSVVNQHTDSYSGDTFDARFMTDHEALHELCHWLVAEKCQRDFPEFGLDWGLVFSTALGPKDGTYRLPSGRLNMSESFLNDFCRVVDIKEAEIQELLAQQLSVALGEHFGISPYMTDDDYISQTWTHYLNFKLEENSLNPLAVQHRLLIRQRVDGLFKSLMMS